MIGQLLQLYPGLTDIRFLKKLWKYTQKSLPWQKWRMLETLTLAGIPQELGVELTLAELTEVFSLVNVMSK